jgi:hypothetical protein
MNGRVVMACSAVRWASSSPEAATLFAGLAPKAPVQSGPGNEELDRKGDEKENEGCAVVWRAPLGLFEPNGIGQADAQEDKKEVRYEDVSVADSV